MSKIINRHGNFTLVPNGFIEADVTHETFRLYVTLLSYAKGNASDGGDVFPSYDTLKTKTRIQSYSTIARALRDLETKGWLERRKRFGASTLYTLTSPTPSVVMDKEPVLHGVECSPTPGVVQSYTPSKTNKTQVTKHNEQDPLKRARASRRSALLTEHADPIVSSYIEILRPEGITVTNADIMLKRVKELSLWRDVLTRWATAAWNPTNFTGLFENYDRMANAKRVASSYKKPGPLQHFDNDEYQRMLIESIKGGKP